MRRNRVRRITHLSGVTCLLVIALGLLLGQQWAEAQTTDGYVVSSDTGIAIGIVALLLAAAAGWGAAQARMGAHMGSEDIHHSLGDLLTQFKTRSACRQDTDEIKELLRELGEKLDQIRNGS